jgi:AcrR family transcriptional regulator
MESASLPEEKGPSGLTTLKTFQNIPAEKQERIIRVAVDEFSRNGFHGASINTIINRLGIAKGSIFQYFGDKQGLFLFVFENSVEQVKDYLRQVRDRTLEEDIFTRLENTLLAGIRFTREHPQLYSLYLKVLFDPHIPFRDQILLSLREYSRKYLRTLLEQACAKGELRDDLNLDAAGFILDAVMDRFLQSRTILHLDGGLGIYQSDEDRAEEQVRGIIDEIRRGIGKRKLARR